MFAHRQDAPAIPPRVARIAGGPAPSSARRMRICVVTEGEGTVLVAALRATGADVSVLDVCWNESGRAYPAVEGTSSLQALYVQTHPFMPLRSLCVHDWISRQTFDHVIVCASMATAYYATVARGLGVAHMGTGLWICGGRSHAFDLQSRAQFPAGRTDIELDYLERQAVARADGIIFIDEQAAAWMGVAGWQLPGQCLMWGDDSSAGGLLSVLAAWSGSSLAPPVAADDVKVSVCMPTYNRPAFLQQALASLARQTVQDFEVVVVDDGSTDPAVSGVLGDFALIFPEGRLKAIRQDNAGPAVARRTARGAATGTHLLFMDDDNVALAHEIERFVLAARSGADIVACIPGQHPECDFGPAPVTFLETPDSQHPKVGVDWTPVGASPALAMLVNCLGDTNSLIRASVYDALGGHQGGREFLHEDYDLFVRAMFSGYRLEVLPEALYLYRRHAGSRVFGDQVFNSLLTSLDPFLERVPSDMHPLFLMLRHDWLKRHLAVGQVERV